MPEALKTTDHETIRHWIQARGGKPATVTSTKEGDHAGILRVDFPIDGPDQGLEAISWGEFFDKFDQEELAFLYQEQTADGRTSRFFKFIHAEGK